jgi:hypothetical protein
MVEQGAQIRAPPSGIVVYIAGRDAGFASPRFEPGNSGRDAPRGAQNLFTFGKPVVADQIQNDQHGGGSIGHHPVFFFHPLLPMSPLLPASRPEAHRVPGSHQAETLLLGRCRHRLSVAESCQGCSGQVDPVRMLLSNYNVIDLAGFGGARAHTGQLREQLEPKDVRLLI